MTAGADHRSCDSEALNPLRLRPSGMREKKNLWEIHHDPYDVSRIFVRGPEGWITVFWKHLDRVPMPFGELAWDHARRSLVADGRAATEEQIADSVAALLRRAHHGPDNQEKPKMSKRDRRVAARTKATTPPATPPAAMSSGSASAGKQDEHDGQADDAAQSPDAAAPNRRRSRSRRTRTRRWRR